jgi:excinuclease ABC subunit C
MAVAPALTLPLGETARLRRRVAALAENRPAVYRMLDPAGRVLYVGKAKRLRSRLLSYFRAQYPDDKAARILHAATDIRWDYVPSEFAAFLGELGLIRRHRPPFNLQMNRPRRWSFLEVSCGPAPKLYVGRRPAGDDVRHYGPFAGGGRLQEALRVLNDLLGLRDCTLRMPVTFAEQGDLFTPDRRAGCLRHELRTCTGPCAGFVTEAEYLRRVELALAFIEGRAVDPLDRVIAEITAASARDEFERAAGWRDKFDVLVWLLGAAQRVQSTLDSMTFVYIDPGTYGDDRAYVVRRATVRAAAPAPRTPIELAAFHGLVAAHAMEPSEPGPIPSEAIDETLLLLSWFRRHPRLLQRTTPLEQWLADHPQPA